MPMHKVQCGRLIPKRYPQAVIGSPKGALGYRVRERADCKIVPYEDRSMIEKHEEEMRREYEHLIKTMDFEEQTDRKIDKKKVWKHVQQGLAAHEETVNSRRRKLREILLREQVGLVREVVDQAQHGDDARMEEMRQRTEELQRQQEAQRLALVAAKKTQQYLSQCPDIRERVVKQYTVEVKEGNLIQMAENEAKRQADEEVERLWHNLMLKDVEAKKEREVEEAKKRSLQDRDMVTTLEKQIAGRLLLEEQKKQVQKEDKEYVECLIEEMRKDEVQRAENIRIKRQVLKRDLQEQVLNAKRRLAEQACREREIDRLRDNLVADEIAKERRKMKESSTVLRNELLAYLRYLEDLRKEEARRNLAVDRIVEESMKKANARRDLAVKRFKEARQRGLQEVLRSREEQMRLKCQMDREEEERRRLEKEEVEKEIEMEAKLAARAKEEAKDRKLRYKQYLEEQQKHADEARRRETEEEERWHQEEVKRREESLKLTNELLMASENIIPHPFKALLKQCIARYEAEKNNQCDCLYPLSLE